MSDDKYIIIAGNFIDAADVPKDDDLDYRCTKCGTVIKSIPDDNTGCTCGNIFIDIDSWRLETDDFRALQVLRKTMS